MSTAGIILWAFRWLGGKEFTCSAGDTGSIHGQEDALEEGMATHFSVLYFHLIYFNWRIITLQYYVMVFAIH